MLYYLGSNLLSLTCRLIAMVVDKSNWGVWKNRAQVNHVCLWDNTIILWIGSIFGWLYQPWKNWFKILDIIFYNLMGAHNFLVPEISATSHYNLFTFFWPASISLLFTCHSCRNPMFNYRFGCPPASVLNIIHLFLYRIS